MSLVQALIGKKFIVACSDGFATLANGETVDDYKKLFKINDDIIIGITGVAEHNYQLFDYCIQNETVNNSDYDFRCVVSETESRLKFLAQLMSSGKIEMKINSCICGWNGDTMIAKAYSTVDVGANGFEIVEVVPGNDEMKIVTCGCDEATTQRHQCNFNKYWDYYNKSYKDMSSIVKIKQTFTDTLKEGCQFDNTINDKAYFEIIKHK